MERPGPPAFISGLSRPIPNGLYNTCPRENLFYRSFTFRIFNDTVPVSRGSSGCITIHPDDAAAFFKNFIWNPQKFTGNSVGKIIIFRKNSQNKDDQYKRILKHLIQ